MFPEEGKKLFSFNTSKLVSHRNGHRYEDVLKGYKSKVEAEERKVKAVVSIVVRV